MTTSLTRRRLQCDLPQGAANGSRTQDKILVDASATKFTTKTECFFSADDLPPICRLASKTLWRVDPNNLRFFFSCIAISVLEVRLKEEGVAFAHGDLLAL